MFSAYNYQTSKWVRCYGYLKGNVTTCATYWGCIHLKTNDSLKSYHDHDALLYKHNNLSDHSLAKIKQL